MKLGTSYFGNRILRHVAEDMQQLKRQNFTYVVHCFNENDYQFYRQQMKKIVDVTHDAGLEAYMDPWGVGKVFGGEAFSNFVCCNLDKLQILNDGKPGGMACPMEPTFRQFMVDWIDAVIETGADGIFWDEPHFALPNWLGGRPGAWGCRCNICSANFRERFGYEMPTQMCGDVAMHLEDGIRDFLAFVIAEAKKRGTRNVLCMLPHEETVYGAPMDWDKFAGIPGLDAFGMDPYFEWGKKDVTYVEKYAKLTKEVADRNGVDSQLWFQAFKIASGREKLQIEAMELAYNAGVRDFAVWGFEACDQISWIRPDDPEKMWALIVEEFGRLLKKG